MNICLISGGKDSQATAIYLKNEGVDCSYVFCDTGWEDLITYDFINNLGNKLSKPIKWLKPERLFVDMVKKRSRFPSSQRRFCTQKLKVEPMIDYILTLKESVNIYQGMRWSESKNRASLEKTDDYFKYYFEPYKITAEGKKKYYTYRKKEIIEWLKKYSATAIRPIISWSTKDVFEYIIDNGFMPNKLYQYGFTRVGCFPCIMCTKEEIAKVVEYRPKKIEYISNLEKELNSTFFPPDYIPARFCSKKITKIDKTTNKPKIVGIPSMMDVVSYVNLKGYGSGLFTGSHCQNHILPCE